MPRIPNWIRLEMRAGTEFGRVHNLVGGLGLHTVCKSAKCPNIHTCWGSGTATLMLLGNLCTRACRFCAVPAGRPQGPDREEPRRAAAAAKRMSLRHVVLTSVTRDDLEDGGAGIFAETIREIRRELPEATVEVLTPDFEGKASSLRTVLEARPDVFNHNLETVRRLQPAIRPQASYRRSLGVLRAAAAHAAAPVVKSGLMLGFGETADEVREALRDLRDAGGRALTLGQYLQPTRHHRPVDRYWTPDEFRELEEYARAIGFAAVASGPMVRSSFQADALLKQAREAGAVAPA